MIARRRVLQAMMSAIRPFRLLHHRLIFGISVLKLFWPESHDFDQWNAEDQLSTWKLVSWPVRGGWPEGETERCYEFWGMALLKKLGELFRSCWRNTPEVGLVSTRITIHIWETQRLTIVEIRDHIQRVARVLDLVFSLLDVASDFFIGVGSRPIF